MKARWFLNYPPDELPIVAQAIVASWVPSKYYFVSTIQLDSSSPLQRLTQSITQGVKYEEATLGPDGYLTQVFKCNKVGVVRSVANPLYECKYTTVSEAIAGHRRTVDLLEQGRLKLSK